jgi:predicted ATPase/DNA-binding CsgD family transcriptional regulator
MAQEHSFATANPPPISDLPSYLTSFLGREEELGRLGNLLRQPRVRLVTITGFGGIGKTRLATALVSSMTHEWQRIWFVSLAHIHEASTANSLIARELEIEANGPSADPSVRHDLQTAPCLLVLDNFEHLVDAADQIPALLQTWPLLTILVTSRAPLNLSGEQVYPLQPLNINHAGELGSAVDLFIDRAHLHSHDFRLAPGDHQTVRQICQRLEGIPLAIELAAARMSILTPLTLLNRLSSQLSLLTGGPRDAPARQRTLRDTIAWSYNLLPPAAQDALNALSVFSGGFTLDAAAEVLEIPPDGLTDMLVDLVASTLVVIAPSPLIPQMRYRLLDPVREYAFDRLTTAGRATALQLAHARFFTAFAEAAIPLYEGPDLPQVMRAICAETDNFRVAMSWSLSSGNREAGVRLAGAISLHWPYSLLAGDSAWRDRMAEGQRWIALALEQSEGLPAASVREALMGNIFLKSRIGDITSLSDDLAALRELAAMDGDRYTLWWATLTELLYRPDLTAPIVESEQTLALLLDLAGRCENPEYQMSITLLEVGWLLHLSGQREEAAPAIRRGYELAVPTRNPLYLAMAGHQMAEVAIDEGDLSQALAMLRETNVHMLAFGTYYSLSPLYLPLIRIALRTGRQDLAITMLTTRQSIMLTEADEQLRGQGANRELEWRRQVLAEFREIAGETAYQQVVAATPVPPQRQVIDIIEELERELTGMDRSAAPSHPLSAREIEVLRLLARGDSNHAIAEALFISERTVENHVRSILARLNVANRAGAAAWAVRHGLA